MKEIRLAMSNNTDTLLREFAFIEIRILTALGDIRGAIAEPEEELINNHIDRLRNLLDKLMPTEKEIEDKVKKKYTRKEYQAVFIIACRWVRLIMKGAI